MSLAFKTLVPGLRYTGTARTITDAEIALLPAIMGAISPLFHDEVSAQRGPLGGRVLYGPAVLGIVIALTESSLHDLALGLLGIDALRFLKPVRSGETITAHFEVDNVKFTSDPGRAVVHLSDWAVNEREERVIEFKRTVMVRTS